MLNIASEPVPVEEITTLEALRVVTDSQRHRILCLLIDRPLTAGAIAKRLKINRTPVYYHLDLLVQHGMIRIVSERRVAAMTERTYRAVAKHFRVNRSVLAATASVSEIVRSQSEILEQAADDVRASSDPELLVSRTFIQLRPEDARALRAELLELTKRYHERAVDTGENYEFAMALFSTEGMAS
jgi:predicted ArsR family transcriptional regulator